MDGLMPAGVLAQLKAAYQEQFGPLPGRMLAVVAPGRTEIAGNHTDHEGGQVIAGAVDRYVSGLFVPNGSGRIRLYSVGYGLVDIDGADLSVHEEERNGTAALVRGLVAGMRALGYGEESSGFDACITSEVPAGSGLSSSAAFELEVAQALDALWADGALPPVKLAQLSQAAERDFFGKPCGLMDQASVALGGIAHMDFANADEPQVEKLDFDFSRAGYALCLVAVGQDHAASTADYAAVPQEMQAVAHLFGAGRLCEVAEADVLAHLGSVRERLGDRAALRALHYFREERLVEERACALKAGDMERFLELERLSGASSAMYLQNVSTGDVQEQPAMVALAVAEELLHGQGAVRIHGGGFGGTIQAFVRLDEAEAFCQKMDAALGEAGAAASYAIDHEGARSQWL